MKKYLFLTAFIFLYNCNSDDNNTINKFKNNKIEFEILMKGNILEPNEYNIPEFNPQYSIITDSQNWNTFNNLLTNFSNKDQEITNNNTPIDFNNYVVLKIFDEVKFAGLHSINVDSIIEQEIDVKIYIKKVQIYDNAFPVTQPYNVIKFNKINKPITYY